MDLAWRDTWLNLWHRRTDGYMELPELMAEVAAAKELLAGCAA